jgi:hypothetical protein
VPAQPLLAAAPFGDQVVAVVEQELQLTQSLLPGTRVVEPRLALGGAGDRERVGLAADTAAPTRQSGQSRRHADEALAGLVEQPLERAADVAAVLECPEPLARRRPAQEGRLERAAPAREFAAELVDGDRRQVVLVHVHPITIMGIAFFSVGGDRRADRPQSRQLPSSYQVALGGLGKAAATQRWQVSQRRRSGIGSAAASPSLLRTPDATTRRRGQ